MTSNHSSIHSDDSWSSPAPRVRQKTFPPTPETSPRKQVRAVFYPPTSQRTIMTTTKSLLLSLALVSLLSFAGCSRATGPILPQGELTQEQLEKIKAEDRAIENEESQGSIKN